MGGSRGPLGGFFEQPLRSYTLLGGPGIVREVLKHDLGHLGAVLGPSWGRLGLLLGPCGPLLGSSWGLLRHSWGFLGIILGIFRRKTRMHKNIEKAQYVLHFWATGSPKTDPRRAQEPVKTAKTAPRGRQDGPRGRQDGPKRIPKNRPPPSFFGIGRQEPPRTPRDPSKIDF